MKRAFAVVVVGVAIASTAAFATSAQTPILTGPVPMSGAGFGQVKPRTIYLGGDPTGLVCRIHWLSWGGQLAVGTGTGWYVGPHEIVAAGHAAPAVVVLYRLGTYRGQPAYKRYTWSFPGNGTGFGHQRFCNA